jgi:hypothetical protein
LRIQDLPWSNIIFFDAGEISYNGKDEGTALKNFHEKLSGLLRKFILNQTGIFIVALAA